MNCETCIRGILMVVMTGIALYCFGMIPTSPEVAAAYAITGVISLVIGVSQYVTEVYLVPSRTSSVFEGR